MLKMMIRNMALVLALTAAPVCAQDEPSPLPAEALLKLAERPDLDGIEFEQALSTILPLDAVDRELVELPFQDPFLWFFASNFEVQSSGTIHHLTCSRHGVVTGEWYYENRNTSIEAMLLSHKLLSLGDPPLSWPEGAVAFLQCSYVVRKLDLSLADLTEVGARAALSTFQIVSGPESQTDAFGPGGYQVIGQGGASNSVAQVSNASIMRNGSYLTFFMRSFLINSPS